MPKKTPKNPYYFFMLDFRETQKKNGVIYANMGEVQAAADPLWKKLTPHEKQKFEAIAKKEKEKNNVPENKYTSYGASFAEIDRQTKLSKEAEKNEVTDIKNFIKLKSYNSELVTQRFYIMDVNSYCKTSTDYLIGEVSMIRFSIAEGVIDNFSLIFNSVKIPIGYASDVKLGCIEFDLKMPDESIPPPDCKRVLADTIDYLTQDTKKRDLQTLPPIYTMPEKVEQVQSYIQNLCYNARERDIYFRVYKLDTLFFHLINNIKSNSNEGLPQMSLATSLLQKDYFKYTSVLPCKVHRNSEKCMDCTLSRVKRWAYTICDNCCPILGIEVGAGRHVPHEVDIDTVMACKAAKKEIMKAVVSPVVDDGASCSSFVAEAKPPSKVERKHMPLRMPQKDFAAELTQATAQFRVSNIDDHNEFPALSGGGRGRGRNMRR